MKNKYFFILFCLSLLLAVNTVSAIELTQVNTVVLPQAVGNAGLVFDTNGLHLFAFDSNLGVQANYVSEYNLGSAYNLSTLSYSGNSVNITAISPHKNYTVTSGYITRDGHNLYVTEASDINDFPIGHYDIVHFTLNNFDLTTLNFSDYASTTFTNYAYNPSLNGIYVSDNGAYLMVSGAWFEGSASAPRSITYSLTTPYNISLATPTTNPYLFTCNSYYSGSTDNNIFGTPDFNLLGLIQGGYIMLHYNSLQNGTCQIMATPTSTSGLYIASTFSNLYLFTEKAGSLYEYQIVNLSYSYAGTGSSNSIASSSFIDGILSIFPDANTLTLGEKMGFVFITMLITAIVILFAGHGVIDGVDSIIMFIVVGLEIVEFIFFAGIGYIPVGFVIIAVMFAIGLGYLAVRGRGS